MGIFRFSRFLCSKIGPRQAHWDLHEKGPIREQMIRFSLIAIYFNRDISLNYEACGTGWMLNLARGVGNWNPIKGTSPTHHCSVLLGKILHRGAPILNTNTIHIESIGCQC